jgi:clathrin heavy chain
LNGNNDEAIRIIRNRSFYDPEKIRSLIATSFLSDPRPMIVLCDKHSYLEFLTQYLFKNNQFHPLIMYISQKENSKGLPRVLGELLDIDTPQSLELASVIIDQAGECDHQQMIMAFESRKKLPLLQSWVEK